MPFVYGLQHQRVFLVKMIIREETEGKADYQEVRSLGADGLKMFLGNSVRDVPNIQKQLAATIILNFLPYQFIVPRTREVLLYRDSSDPNVAAAAGIEVRMGRKWRAAEALKKGSPD